jgi:hypothetical protein
VIYVAIIFGLLVLIALRFLWIWRSYIRLNKHIDIAMEQIGTHLSNRFYALNQVLDVAKGYDFRNTEIIILELAKSRKNADDVLNPSDVVSQELAFKAAERHIQVIVDHHPTLVLNPAYIKAKENYDTYDSRAKISRIVYNDLVKKLNRRLNGLITGYIGDIMKIEEREFLEEPVLEEAENGG